MSGASGLYSSLRGFAKTSVALLRTRLELLKVEAQEEIVRIRGAFFWGIAALILGVAGAFFLAIFLTVLFWDTHRLLVIGLFTSLFLVGAAVALGITLRLVRQQSQLFAASLAELRRDERALDDGESPT